MMKEENLSSGMTISPIKALNHPSKETLDVFGRLLYAVAMADGEVQQSEIETLESIVKNDEWASKIELSFKCSSNTEMNPHTMFMKNMRIFFTNSVNDHYPYFLNLMEKMASANNGIVDAERKMLVQFKDMYSYVLETNNQKAIEYNYKVL